METAHFDEPLVGAGQRGSRSSITSIIEELDRVCTEGHEEEIVEGDLADIDSCDAVLADFTAPDEGTAMETWYAHSRGVRVVAYSGGKPPHPWTVYVAESVHPLLDDAIAAL